MKFAIFNKFGALNSAPVFKAFGQGLDRLGLSWSFHDNTADVAVIWSVLWAGRMRDNREIWNLFRSSQRTVIVLEVGTLFRGHTWKMSANGVGRGAVWAMVEDPQRPARLGLHVDPWRTKGNDIVVACQRHDSLQWDGQPAPQQWLDQTVASLRQHTDRPIRVRCHPRQTIAVPAGCLLEKPVHLPGTYDQFDFDQSLNRAWCVVNWNSGPGVRSALSGVPALVGPDSLAAPVSTVDWSMVESPHRPDRDQWLINLSHTEWTCAELETGRPLRLLLDRL